MILYNDIGADSASISILQHIHEHCQKALIIMATRPIKDYNVIFIDQYRATGSYIEISLNGLGEYEIGEIILQNFDSGVDRISPKIVKVVQVSLFNFVLNCDTKSTNTKETYWWKSFICQVNTHHLDYVNSYQTNFSDLEIWRLF